MYINVLGHDDTHNKNYKDTIVFFFYQDTFLSKVGGCITKRIVDVFYWFLEIRCIVMVVYV